MQANYRTGIFAAVGMFVLILDSKTAISAAQDAIGVCIRSVIPSLLPFFVLSILLTDALKGSDTALLRPLGRLCRMSPGSESILILGLLGGYPAGAQCISQSYQNGSISRSEAQRLLGFCSNAGPAFLFGICSSAFASGKSVWYLWIIHILSAILTGVLLPGGHHDRIQRASSTSETTVPDALKRSIVILSGICGWIMLFRIVLEFCQRWFLWLLPQTAQTAVAGILELSNGCLELTSVAPEGLRFIVCSGILAFGGICVCMQTQSVTGALGMGLYFPGKIVQAAISVILSLVCQFLLFDGSDRLPISVTAIMLSVCCIGSISLLLQNRKNFSRFSAGVGV